MNQPGLDITVHSGGPITGTAGVAYQVCNVTHLAQFNNVRVRKITVQSIGTTSVSVGYNDTHRGGGSQNGVQLFNGDSCSFNNVKPEDIYFMSASTNSILTYLIEM